MPVLGVCYFIYSFISWDPLSEGALKLPQLGKTGQQCGESHTGRIPQTLEPSKPANVVSRVLMGLGASKRNFQQG